MIYNTASLQKSIVFMMAPQTPHTRTSVDTYDLTDTIQCIQGNLRRSHQAQLNLFIDLVNKRVYKDDINVIFVTEPYTVSKSNTHCWMFLMMSTTSSLNAEAGRHW